MSKLPGVGNQEVRGYLYRADGTITSGNVAQVVLGMSMARSLLFFQNISTTGMQLEIGCAAAHAVINSSGVVTSVVVDNAGLGFSNPPLVRFLGGGQPPNWGGYGGLAQVNGAAPSNVAQAQCNMTGTAPNQTISSITVISGGGVYTKAPYVQLINSDLDPNGGPAVSATTGIAVAAGAIVRFDATVCPTEAVSVWGPTTGQAYVLRYMD